ncbi:MAG: Eco57I restriction-modification methylase domain-containing protein [Bacteroidota bacterium]
MQIVSCNSCLVREKFKPVLKDRSPSLSNSLVSVSDILGVDYARSSSVEDRKLMGQFFTSKEVALFMASQFSGQKRNIRLLDPGAGIGSLTAAFCEVIKSRRSSVSLTVDLYENDKKIIPLLEKVLLLCKSGLESRGHEFCFNIIEKNFILDNPNFLKSRTLLNEDGKAEYYDYVICNPPYYKLNKDSEESILMKEFVSGQPNIYPFFMALSLEMLKPKGEMVFITPRSFCSGLYFKKFRRWLVDNGVIDSIHIFDSRKSVFGDMNVLQENVIVKIIAENPVVSQSRKATVSVCLDSNFKDTDSISFDYEDLFHKKSDDVFIKIPSKQSDIEIQHAISPWEHSVASLGLKASTGPVVSFRSKEHLCKDVNSKKCVPLLWMHNLKGFDVEWPLENKKEKEPCIKSDSSTMNILLPVKNYVLVKRFSSKEQNRRLYAAVFKKSDFEFDYVGVENHLNYIYKKNGDLSLDEAYGIAALLNSVFIDKFFRMLNGNTQVNVVDINNLPFPSKDVVSEIGSRVRMNEVAIGVDLDSLIVEVAKIDKRILDKIYREDKNGKN